MLLVLLLAAAGLLLAPQAAASGALQGLRACGTRVIPALLPFFVVSRMLTALSLPTPGRRADRLFRALFGVRAACLPALLTGLLGGYPAGAAAVTELYRAGALSKAEAERALCFCNNSGPGFFAGLIGAAVLGDVRRGLILYGLHALSALLTGLLLPGSAPPAALRTARREKPVLSSLLPEAVQGSCAALLQVSGLIVFFSSMLAVLRAAGLTALLPNRLAEALACGALELSSGILLLWSSPILRLFFSLILLLVSSFLFVPFFHRLLCHLFPRTVFRCEIGCKAVCHLLMLGDIFQN